MSEVTHKVVWGDTLWALAKKHGTTVESIASLNGIKNPDRIYVGQTLVIKNKSITSSSGGSSTSSPSSTTVSISAFGLQSNTDNLIFAVWNWSKSNTDHYAVEWSYYTDNGIWFTGNNSDVKETESTYSAPSNAVKVRCRIKPVSTTYKDKNDNEVSHWSGSWCAYKEYTMSDNPPAIPPVPTVELDKYTMKIRNENLDINAWDIEYEIVQNDSTVFHTGRANIKTNTTSYSLNLSPGSRYKVRARGIRGSISGKWSEYTQNYSTMPNAPSGIHTIKALSTTSVQLMWDRIESAETYSIQYAEQESYFEGSNGTTTIDNVESASYIITGLTTGKRYYFRIKSVNASGSSAWSGSRTIALGTKPEPPSTWSDRTSATIGEKILLSWVHNSVDGSSQMQTQLEFLVNNVSDTYELGLDINEKPISTFELPTHMFTDGTKVYWRARTKGVTGEYSEWSTQRVIEIYAPPTLSVTLTSQSGNVINNVTTFPFFINAIPGASSQKPIMYSVAVRSKESYTTNTPFGEVYVKSGDEIFSDILPIKKDLKIEMHAGNIDLENNISYEVVCTVTMDSGLSVEASKSFSVKWEDVFASPNAEILIDRERLSASIRPYCERYENTYMVVELRNNKYYETTTELPGGFQNGTSVDGTITYDTKRQVYRDEQSRLFCVLEDSKTIEVTDVTLSIYRRTYDGKFVEIVTGLDGANNTFVTDPHPSLDYARYRIVSASKATGAISYTDLSSQAIDETGIIVQWDESWSNFKSDGQELEDVKYSGGSLIRLPYNISISETNTPDVSVVNYIGREHPVSYYGTSLGVTSTWSTEVDKTDADLLYAIRRLSMYMGDVYVREPSGIGYWANVKVSYDKTYNSLVIPVSFNITRVEGGI